MDLNIANGEEDKMMTLLEENGSINSSKTLFYNNKIKDSQQSQDEIEQFSLRLSTALRRNRNLDSASSILFTKVSRKPLQRNENEDGNGFSTATTTTMFTTSKELWMQQSIEEKEREIVEDVHQQPAAEPSKDTWSLNACLSEINSISYDKVSTFKTTESNVYIKKETNLSNLSLNNGNFQLPFITNQNESNENESERPKSINRHTIFPRLETAYSMYSSEEELLFDENESVGSSASSMSWAPDAMEAKLTLQLARLWEDIELVCSGQIGEEKPKGMSHSEYEECLLWKHAFPEKSQHPSRFSTMTLIPEDEEEDDSDSTPTPTNATQAFDFDSPPVSAKCRPSSLRKYPDVDDYYDFESRAENCVTPNPNTSTEYVSAWLITHTQKFGQQDEMELLHENISMEGEGPRIKSPVLPTIEFRNMLQGNVVSAAAGRPLSSNSVGHLITPIPTGNYPVQRVSHGKVTSPKYSVPQKLNQPIQTNSVGGSQNVPTYGCSTQVTQKQPDSYLQKKSAIAQQRSSSIRRAHGDAKNEVDLDGGAKETPFLQWLLDSGR